MRAVAWSSCAVFRVVLISIFLRGSPLSPRRPVRSSNVFGNNRRGERKSSQRTQRVSTLNFRLRFFRLHLLQRRLRRGSFSRLDRLPFTARNAVIPFQLNVEHSLVRGAQRFHDRVLRRRLVVRLELLLEHGLRISSSSVDRISRAQFFSQGTLDKFSGGFQPTIEKDSARHSFENIGKQSMLATAAALLFTAAEPNKLAEPQRDRCLRQSRSTHQAMLHAR